jgi:subtilisin family serine protease
VVRLRQGPTDQRGRLLGSLPPETTLSGPIVSGGRTFHVVRLPGPEARAVGPGTPPASSPVSAVELLRNNAEIEFAAPVFFYPATGARVLPTDEVVVRVKPGGPRHDLAGLAASFGLTLAGPMWGTSGEYVLRLVDPIAGDAIERSRALHDSGHFEWAEPNFIQSYVKQALPDDPRFGQQWHLHNIGQGGGTPGADVRAVQAWDLQRGSSAVVIAVVDDGVDKTHEDLAANIFVNPGDTPGNGVDDDGNGFVDDANGWDFSNGDSDASPASSFDNHGTAVAGVAAARGNNGIGVSGACQECRILPVKISTGNSTSDGFASDAVIANAIRYAATLADVINNSWGGGAPSSIIQSSIQDAITTGRGGKGAVVLAATGNAATGYRTFTVTGFPAGTYTFRFAYTKDETVSSGEDAAWLGWVQFPGGELVTFDHGFPAGWTGGGDASWSIATDPARADEGRCLTRSARSGTVTHGQTTYLEVTKSVPAGNLVMNAWVSSENGFDGIELFVNDIHQGFLLSGVPFVSAAVSYPAAHPETIAVGASSNMDCRAAYSQYGPELAFVAPSSGGPLNLRVESTDRMGPFGYDAGNYTQAPGASGFGGTSSAAPLAAGIAGLILSRNNTLPRTQVLQIMQDTADKVGPDAYAGGRNNRYGSGRLNAFRALQATPAGPVVLTLLASDVTVNRVTVTGLVNPDGSSTTAVFEYGLTPSYGNQVNASPAPGAGTSPVVVSASITGLACSTTYHYRIGATNALGSAFGLDQVFRTLECAGITNVFLQHGVSGCMVAWHMNGVSLVTQDFIVPACVADPNWRIAGVADFDSDAKDDLLFQHTGTGGILVWLMNGIVIKEQRFLTPAGVSDPNWRVVAVGDFDADARPDLIIQNRADGRMVAWLLTGTVLKAQVFLNPSGVADPAWGIVGAGDVDLDGKPDLFFQNAASGFMVQWLMDGINIRRQDFINPSQVDPAWAVSAIVDVNHDRRPDMILQNVDDGRMVAWPLHGPNLIGQRLLDPFQVSDPRWRIVGPR